MNLPFQGGCLCGAVRYACSAEPMFSGHCQCTDCRKDSGTGHGSHLAVPKGAVTISGESKIFEKSADSGNTVTRRFCPECGSPLFSELSASPGLMIIKVGSLDDPSWAKPTMNIWTDSAQPWCELSDELPRHGKQPQG